MSTSTGNGTPRRAAAVDSSVEEFEVEVVVDQPKASPRRRSIRFGRPVVAAALAGLLATGTLFGYAFSARGAAGEVGMDSGNVAIPAAAVEAVAHGFADRSEAASRNAVRSSLAGAVADENAKEREAALDASVAGANEVMTADAMAERDAQMDADMVLVAEQADKLKKEAEEAQARLEAARKAVASYGGDVSKLSDADIEAMTTQGGSMPVKSNYRMSAGYGQRGSWSRYHTGQDFAAPTGTPIYAAASGIVLSPTSGSWAGINVVIQHIDGDATLYAHMSKRIVSPGEAVKAGQLIGYVGNTGRSYGSHLHFEYYKAGTTPGDVYQASNPMTFLRNLGVR